MKSNFWLLFSDLILHFFYFCVFSPVKYDKKVLELIGRKLKKNSVALDIVNFGEEDEEKTEKLEALLAAVNNNDSSHIVHVPPGPSALSDVLIRFYVILNCNLCQFKLNLLFYNF